MSRGRYILALSLEGHAFEASFQKEELDNHRGEEELPRPFIPLSISGHGNSAEQGPE